MLTRMIALFAALSLALTPASAQTGYGRTLSGKTHVDRAIGKCAGSMFLSVLAGAAIGAAAGSTRKGALIGLGVGAIVCTVLISAASGRDREVMRAAELDAFNSGQRQTRSWQTAEGQSAEWTVQPSQPGTVLVSQAGSLQCRQDDMCQVGDSWYPKAEILAGRADPKAPKLVKASFTDARELVCRRAQVSMTVDAKPTTDGSDVACLVGDSWVTGDQLKKRKISESHVSI